jgi:hypothetical protein
VSEEGGMTDPDRGFERRLYYQIAEELSIPGTRLSDLNETYIAVAHTWAKRNHKKWPPKPITSGVSMEIRSIP